MYNKERTSPLCKLGTVSSFNNFGNVHKISRSIDHVEVTISQKPKSLKSNQTLSYIDQKSYTKTDCF